MCLAYGIPVCITKQMVSYSKTFLTHVQWDPLWWSDLTLQDCYFAFLYCLNQVVLRCSYSVASCLLLMSFPQLSKVLFYLLERAPLLELALVLSA